ALNSVFRGFHTIKGLAGFLELWEVQSFSHEVETILDRARNSQLIVTPAAVDLILQASDYLRRWLSHVESKLQQHPTDEPGKDIGLLERIRALSRSASPPTPKIEEQAPGAEPAAELQVVAEPPVMLVQPVVEEKAEAP